MKHKFFLCIFLILMCSDLSLKSQDSLHYQWERFSVRLGGFLTTLDSDISLTGQQTGLGVNLNLEKALGLKTRTTFVRGEAEYNFGLKRRSNIRLSYFGLVRNANKRLESELEFGDSIYPIGTEIRSRYDLFIIRGLYDYDFYGDNRIKLGLSAGLYVLPVNFSVGTGNIIDESAAFIAPLPVVGLRNAFFITPKILFKQNLEVLYVKTSHLTGTISDVNIWIEYNPFVHFGVGLGYNNFRFRLSASRPEEKMLRFDGTLSTGFTGLLFYGKYYF
jgi:hypothetical protein